MQFTIKYNNLYFYKIIVVLIIVYLYNYVR